MFATSVRLGTVRSPSIPSAVMVKLLSAVTNAPRGATTPPSGAGVPPNSCGLGGVSARHDGDPPVVSASTSAAVSARP